MRYVCPATGHGVNRAGRTAVVRLIAAFGLLAFLIAGCGPTTWRNLTHPEYGQAELDRDKYECQKENTFPGVGVYGGAGMRVDYNLATACMKARGWQPVKE